MKSAKTKEKENRSFTGDPGVSKNHATAHKHYSFIWVLASHLEPWVVSYSNTRSFLFSPFVQRPGFRFPPEVAPAVNGWRRDREDRVALELFAAMVGLEVQQGVIGGGRPWSSASCPWRTEGESRSTGVWRGTESRTAWREGGGEWMRKWGALLAVPTRHGAPAEVQQWWGALWCMASTSSPRVAHWGFSTNRWRASKYPRWDADSGLFPAKFGHGPLSKVVNLDFIYNFHLRLMVIRITD